MAEVGTDVLGRLGNERPSFPSSIADGDFEAWLTYLAADQPWLDEGEQLINRGHYLRVSRAVASSIRNCEAQVRASDPPGWLQSLIAYWHDSCASVITFNYDTIVEACYTDVVTVRSRVESEGNYVDASQILHATLAPLTSRTGAVLQASGAETFHMVKLHGSHSWMYSGRESFWGEFIFSAYGRPGWSTSLEYPYPALGEDKVPLVVPPAAGKSTFFQNETVRGEWREGQRMLAEAETIWVLGYSLPDGDQLARQLLQAGVQDGGRVVIVNIDQAVVSRFRQALPHAQVLDEFVCESPLEALVEAFGQINRRPIVIAAE